MTRFSVFGHSQFEPFWTRTAFQLVRPLRPRDLKQTSRGFIYFFGGGAFLFLCFQAFLDTHRLPSCCFTHFTSFWVYTSWEDHFSAKYEVWTCCVPSTQEVSSIVSIQKCFPSTLQWPCPSLVTNPFLLVPTDAPY